MSSISELSLAGQGNKTEAGPIGDAGLQDGVRVAAGERPAHALDIPDMPCAWPVHATAQHHTVISTALPVCWFFALQPVLPAWEGDGLDAWSGSSVALFSCGSLAPVPHCSMLLNSPCAWFLAQVPGSGSLQQGRSRDGNGRVCSVVHPPPS